MERRDPTVHERVDGRRLRGERTRNRVLDALLALVGEGDLHPTAQAVATRAGVALRTVYHHFEDVEALRGMALDVQLDRYRETLTPPSSALPIEDRIHHVVRQCRTLYEAITPIRRATLYDESEAPEMAEGLRRAQSARRALLDETFSPELARAERGRRELLDALDAVTSWHNWYYVRHSLGRTVHATEGIVSATVRALLTPLASL
jgi:TetR/AcrR family transcriptional regulator, regulator of autoinduction and epiphytic fitness